MKVKLLGLVVPFLALSIIAAFFFALSPQTTTQNKSSSSKDDHNAPTSYSGNPVVNSSLITGGSNSSPLQARVPSPEGTVQIGSSAAPQTAADRETRLILPQTSSISPASLLIESSDPNEDPVEIVFEDSRMVPFVLQSGSGANTASLPSPVQAALDNISSDFADSLLEATEGNGQSGNTETAGGETTETSITTPTDKAIRAARDIADQRYRALFGDAAFNRAGIQRALSKGVEEPATPQQAPTP